MTGFTDGGSSDTVYVDDADSNLYLSFDFSKEIGVDATFSDMVMLTLSIWLIRQASWTSD